MMSISVITMYGQGTIKTPKNQTVYVEDGYDTPVLLAGWEADAADWIDINNSDAQRVSSATSNYNCHAYAWHVSDGGDSDDCWLNNIGTNLSKYWTNDAYTSTNSANPYVGKKIFYGSADHSAIPINAYGTVRSKWGRWPRYEHQREDCPYEAAYYAYYAVPLNGDDFVCTSETYSTVNITGATYNWSGSKVSISGSGNSATATKTSDGEGNIQVGISSPYSGTTVAAKKDIWAGQPNASDFTVYVEEWYGDPVSGSPDGPFEVCDNSSYWICLYPFFLFDDQGINDVEFDFNFDYDVLDEGDDYIVIHIDKIYEEDTGEIYVNSECGYTTLKFLDFVEGNCGRYLLVLSPNPATGETTLSIETTSEDTEFDENAEWELEVYSPAQLLKEKKTNLRGKSAKIQTSGWTEGIYMVRVKYKDEALQGKLVVKR
ncbi:MAG: T9SS type A sorting domain-containing protein [Mariniphaga sp.]